MTKNQLKSTGTDPNGTNLGLSAMTFQTFFGDENLSACGKTNGVGPPGTNISLAPGRITAPNL